MIGQLRISYKDHVTNEEVRAKIQQANGPHIDLLTIVKRRKLQWYGHVSRSSSLAKTILQGTVKGGRRQGRQRERWEDNIREWTGLEFGKSQRAVKNREKWRKLVTKSSVVPQRPTTGISGDPCARTKMNEITDFLSEYVRIDAWGPKGQGQKTTFQQTIWRTLSANEDLSP